MTRNVVIMALVALCSGAGGIALIARRADSEPAVYRNRIAGTMLIALAIVLFADAFAMRSWNMGR
jgi:hypothetical protein